MKRTQEAYQALSEINSSITSQEAPSDLEAKKPLEASSEPFQYDEF